MMISSVSFVVWRYWISMNVKVRVAAMMKWRPKEIRFLVQSLFCFGILKKNAIVITTKGIAISAYHGFITITDALVLFICVKYPICSEECCCCDDDR